MAARRWVVNASPFILLGKIEQIALIGALADEIAVPSAVAGEVGARSDGDRTLRAIGETPAFVLVDDEVPPAEVLSWDLGPGETQVIAYALKHPCDRVVIDDLEARRCAKAMNLGVIGTLGIVGRAKLMGLIDQAEPVIRRLLEVGLYASDELVERLLREVGERTPR
jgi:predicted nucleic acid-binding protein